MLIDLIACRCFFFVWNKKKIGKHLSPLITVDEKLNLVRSGTNLQMFVGLGSIFSQSSEYLTAYPSL